MIPTVWENIQFLDLKSESLNLFNTVRVPKEPFSKPRPQRLSMEPDSCREPGRSWLMLRYDWPVCVRGVGLSKELCLKLLINS